MKNQSLDSQQQQNFQTQVAEPSRASQSISKRYKLYRFTLWAFIFWYLLYLLTTAGIFIFTHSSSISYVVFGILWLVALIIIIIGSGHRHESKFVQLTKLIHKIFSLLYISVSIGIVSLSSNSKNS
jgi:hypothetical protein